jgi:hypothetical protein
VGVGLTENLNVSMHGLPGDPQCQSTCAQIISGAVEYCLSDSAANGKKRLSSATYQRLMVGQRRAHVGACTGALSRHQLPIDASMLMFICLLHTGWVHCEEPVLCAGASSCAS